VSAYTTKLKNIRLVHMKAIVTGAAGFIGSHLVELLLNNGLEVIGIDNMINGQQENVDLFINNSNYIFKKIDISDVFDDSLFQDVDYVFHLAGLADIIPSIESPVKYHKSNVTGTLLVLEAAKKSKNLKKFVYAASSSCYGIPKEYPTKEESEIKPEYPYALTKSLGEEYVLHWGKVYGLPIISLRLFNVYGPRARNNAVYGAVFKIFMKQKLENIPLTIVGDGNQKRDFIFVKDVAEAFYLSAISDVKQEIINIGANNPQTINYLADLIGGTKTYLPKRPGEPEITWADISKAKKLISWAPKVSFEEGVQIMIKNIDYYKDAPLYDEAKIKLATKTWFKYLDK